MCKDVRKKYQRKVFIEIIGVLSKLKKTRL